jgi:hypothetical protein
VQPENLKLGGGAAASFLHPVVLAALIVAALLILFAAKKNAIVTVLLMAFLVPLAQQFVVGGAHVLVLRVVILVALIRALFSMIFSKARAFPGGFGTVDWVFMLWIFFHLVAFLILFNFVSAAIVNQFGFLWDMVGGFLVMRFLIQDEDDIDRVIRTFAFLAAILGICMLNERFRMQNVFGLLGGVPAVPETRDGLVRAQATFSHPLLAGTFGATLLPLFFLYWHRGKSKFVAVMGVLGATAMTICASSSTPFLAWAAGIGAVCFWPFRKHTRMLRWGLLILLVALNTVMKAPVWFLIGHIALFGSSSSDHRAYLVDTFIKHFSDWWLYGTNSAGNWGWDMWDTSNQYVAEGESGGIAAFVLFILLISYSFGKLGRARKAVEGDRDKEWYFWLIGCALFSHVIGFFGISYFDQSRMSWFALLVIILAATAPVLAPNAKPVELQPDGAPLNAVPEEPPHPWLSGPRPAPAKKSLLSPPVREFKPRRS